MAQEQITSPRDADAAARADAITALFAGAPDPTDHAGVREFVRSACGLGLALLLILPGTKVPADMREVRDKNEADRAARKAAREAGHRDWERVRSASGLALATTNPDVVLAYLDKYVRTFGCTEPFVAVNLAVHLGLSRLVVVDCDQAGEVDAYRVDAGLPAGVEPTVRSPGKRNAAGEWVHSDGGHFYYVVPAGVELPADANSSMADPAGDYAIMTGARYVLTPPSRRDEGDYRAGADVRVLTDTLRGRITEHGEARRRNRERSVAAAGAGDNQRDPLARAITSWGTSITWDMILGTTPGWVPTGRPDTCGCDIWTAPGDHSSPKSATAHEYGCGLYTDSTEPPLRVWTDHPGEPLKDLVAARGGTLTRFEVYTATHYGGDMGEAAEDLMNTEHAPDLSVPDFNPPLDADPDDEPDQVGDPDGVDLDALRDAVEAEAAADIAAGAVEAAGADYDDLVATIPAPDTAVAVSKGRFADDQLARRCVLHVLRGSFLWVAGIGWLRWTGTHWQECTSAPPSLAWRAYAESKMKAAVGALARAPHNRILKARFEGWRSALSRARLKAVVDLAAEELEIDADQLDADPDILNTPSGIVHLQTGELRDHDPALLCTRITHGSYRRNEDGTPYTHPDVDMLLEALPEPERGWFQRNVGQGITGHPAPRGVVVVMQGNSGDNGKTALTTDGLVPALGDYADVASPRLFSADMGNDHSTERADLRGKRLLIGEELTEGRSLDMTAIKRIMDIGWIKARKVYKDNFTFRATHTLFLTTNPRPVITETDGGSWRRLALLVFPYTFVYPHENMCADTHRPGDPELKERITAGADGQHDALVTFAVEGARQWYADKRNALRPTTKIQADTDAWRAENDRIHGYWAEKLIVPDKSALVLATDLVGEFNLWLTGNGHHPWSVESFARQFADHHETRRNKVVKDRTRSLTGLSRPRPANAYDIPGHTAQQPAGRVQATVWRGVRFRRAEDDLDDRTASRAEVAI